MKKYPLKGLWTATVLSSAFLIGSVAAQAGHETSDTLKDWATAASAQINKEMTYPSMAVRRNEEGQGIYHVTVNRAGEVVNARTVKSPRGTYLRSIARKLAKRAEYPSLPAGYGKDTMTFVLNLNYQIVSSSADFRAQRSRGSVKGEQIAGTGTPILASVTILDGE